MPKVSVVIPNYNHERFLRQRIESVLGQTYQDFELILMDDRSTDGSRAILQEYASDPRVRLEFNERNSGSTFRQWGKGVRLAAGKYVWIAESDDYADPRLLEQLVWILDSEPEVTFAYCRSWRISEDGQRNGFADWYLADIDPVRWTADFRVDGRQACREHFVHANSVPNASAVVFRKAVYERVGGVDETLRVCGDWRLWVLMASEGQIAYVGEPLNYYREHMATVRNKRVESGLIAAEHLRTVRWMFDRMAPRPEVRRGALPLAAFYWIPAVLSRRVPLRRRWSILRDAMAIDPHALRKLIRPAVKVVPLKIAKEWRLARQRFARRA